MPSYAFLGPAWFGPAVSWFFNGPAEHAGEVAQAFARWDEVIDLDFVQAASVATADIVLDFNEIDGALGVLGQTQNIASGFMITGSTIEFDSGEPWSWADAAGTFVMPNGITFTAVALHEIGHAIGLAHTDDPETLMYPTASASVTDLTYWDIFGAQQLYGVEITKPNLSASIPFPDVTIEVIGAQTIPVTLELFNNGLSAGPSLAGVYLSTDSTITTDDILVGTEEISSLDQNDSSPFHTVSVSTAGIPVGTYYVGVIADYDNRIDETHEDDNAASGWQLSIKEAPDFIIVAAPTLSTTFIPQGAIVRVDYDAANLGGGYFAISAGLYLSTDPNITPDDLLLTTIADGIGSGQFSQIFSTNTITPGTYYLGAIADPTNTISESDESNNVSPVIQFTISNPIPLTELTQPTVISATRFVGIGQPFTFSYWVQVDDRENGAMPSKSGIYLSEDSLFSAEDRLLAIDELPAIPAYGSVWSTVTIGIPENVAPGDYYIGVALDIENSVVERIEWNNTSYGHRITPVPFTSGDDVVTLPPLPLDWVAFDGNDRITGSTMVDAIFGGAGNDTIFGGDGSDTIFGDEGNDTLVGNGDPFAEEADNLYGGEDDDIIVGERADQIVGGTGTDVLYAANSYDWSINLGFASIEWMSAGFGNDTIDAGSQSVGVTVYASGGNDWLSGSQYADFLWAGVGDDIVDGGGGADMLFGDFGADNLRGWAGDDAVFADGTDIVFSGGSGYDALYITSGSGMNIDLVAHEFEWLADFAGANDIVTAAESSVAVVIFAGAGDDDVTGGNGGDFLWGEGGNDVLRGGGGDDTLVGEAGSDTLTGGAGIDQLFGGNDGVSDTYVYDSAAAGAFDFIYNFEAGIDKIEFHGVPGIGSAAQLTIIDGAPGGNAEIYLGASDPAHLLFIVVGAAGQVHDSDLLFT